MCSLLPAPGAGSARAQQPGEAVVQALAGILAVEDARNYDGPLLRNAARHPDALVRRHAALALGRIGARAGANVLLELLGDPDSTVQADAAFALGLLGDAASVTPLRNFVLHTAPAAQTEAHAEAVTAIARIGGNQAAPFFTELLSRSATSTGSATAPVVMGRALADAWRLGPDAPVSVIAPFTSAPDPEVRWPAIYSLARLRAPSAADVLLAATDDSVANIRAVAVRELTVSYADSAGIDRGALSARVRRLTADPDPSVRIAALRALATYGTRELAPAAVARASDPDPNVRVQALATLGQLRGTEARDALIDRLDQGTFAVRQQALLGLARVSPDSALRHAARWLAESDWRLRATAAEALGLVSSAPALALLDTLTRTADARVVASALSAIATADSGLALTAARRLIAHPDP
ncbi:MAG: HEAT repeat domain-containing protein, partial [Gemmatimonadetes bacterium]|nr:HEAT repeat domain-containing protein [Gemmatimonadota bacterium]